MIGNELVIVWRCRLIGGVSRVFLLPTYEDGTDRVFRNVGI